MADLAERMLALRRRAYEMLEGGVRERRIDGLCDGFLATLIVLNAAAAVFETEEALAAPYAGLLRWFDIVSVALFTLEYGLRVWVAPERPRLGLEHPWRARLRYLGTPLALIDLAAILPFYLAMVAAIDLRVLRLFRLLRILKITRYSPALATMGRVLRKELRSVVAALVVLLVLILVSSALLHSIEGRLQPEAFGSVPRAMWWSVETLTTVGYGDVIPMTAAGRVVGSVVMLLGIGIFVMWTSIFASGFIEETRRRNFVVTWQLVARVPVFARLDAARIAQIAGLLEPEIVPAHYTVMRRGEPGEAMYFVVSGEVEVDIPPHLIRLGPGHFFGELALLEDSTHQATVSAITETHLLRLDREAFQRLRASEPALEDALRAIAEARRRTGAAHLTVEEVVAQTREPAPAALADEGA